MSEPKQNCLNCKHYYVTWDPNAPKGCRIYQFKTPKMPAKIVEETTGKQCMAFEDKKLSKDRPLRR